MHGGRSRLAVGLLLAAVLFVSGCASGQQADIAESNSILVDNQVTVGILIDAPGFSEGALSPSGFEIDLINYLRRTLGKPIALVPITLRQRASKLNSGEVDLVIATYSITQNAVDNGVIFAGPYLRTPQALLTRVNDKSIEGQSPNLTGKFGCSVATTTAGTVPVPAVQFSSMPETNSGCVSLLRNNAVSVVFTDLLVHYGFMNAFPGQLKVAAVGTYGVTQLYGIGMLNKYTQDCVTISNAVRGFVQSNEWSNSFSQRFPVAADAYRGGDPSTGDYVSMFRPSDGDEQYSCRSGKLS